MLQKFGTIRGVAYMTKLFFITKMTNFETWVIDRNFWIKFSFRYLFCKITQINTAFCTINYHVLMKKYEANTDIISVAPVLFFFLFTGRFRPVSNSNMRLKFSIERWISFWDENLVNLSINKFNHLQNVIKFSNFDWILGDFSKFFLVSKKKTYILHFEIHLCVFNWFSSCFWIDWILRKITLH